MGEQNNSKVVIVSNAVNKILDTVDLILKWFLAVLVLVMTSLITVQVMGRYFLRFSLPWIPEGLRYASGVMTFVGAAYLVRQGEHIGLTLVRDLVSRRTRQIMMLISNLGIMAFLVWVIRNGITLAERHMAVESAAFFRIPLYYPYLILPIGLSITLFYYVLTTILVLLGTSKLLDDSGY